MALPERFSELADAFEHPESHPGWSIGSAEAGWVNPSEEEWGSTPDAAPASPQGTDAPATATQ